MLPAARGSLTTTTRWSTSSWDVFPLWFVLGVGSGLRVRCSEQRAPDEIRRPGDPRQGEEIPAADWLEVLLQRLAVEPGLHADKAFLQVSLVADEQQPHVQLTVFIDAVGVVERPTQDQVGLSLRGARVGQADVSIELGQLAFRVLAVVGNLGFLVAIHGRAGGFDAPDNAFLLLQRGTVPALDEIADDANGMVAAVGGPGGFGAAWLHPDNLVHGLVVVGVRVGRTVTKTEKIARALRRLAGFGWRLRRHAAFLFPAHQQQVRQVFDDVAQGVDIGVRGV